ncbi:MAG: peptidoglycan-binding domain-containing protein [Bosea sp. (in: a-proteobacteria)]
MPANTVSISAMDRRNPDAAPAALSRPKRKKPLWKRVLRSMRRRPGKAAMLMLCTVACSAIAVNALYLQNARHPSPFLAGDSAVAGRGIASAPELPPMRPAELGPSRDAGRTTLTREAAAAPAKEPAVTRVAASRDLLLQDPILREMAQRQPQPVASAPAPEKRVVAAAPKVVAPSPAPAAAPNASSAARDPIAELINGGDHRPPAEIRGTNPVRPVAAAQRALMKLGYGVPKADGRMSDETRSALARFEKDRNIAVTRDLSPRTVRELASASGMRVE